MPPPLELRMLAVVGGGGGGRRRRAVVVAVPRRASMQNARIKRCGQRGELFIFAFFLPKKV